MCNHPYFFIRSQSCFSANNCPSDYFSSVFPHRAVRPSFPHVRIPRITYIYHTIYTISIFARKVNQMNALYYSFSVKISVFCSLRFSISAFSDFLRSFSSFCFCLSAIKKPLSNAEHSSTSTPPTTSVL